MRCKDTESLFKLAKRVWLISYWNKMLLQNDKKLKLFVYLQHHENANLFKNNMNDMKSIVSKNLKMLREASNYKQQEVSDLLEIERGAYANYESGSREMPFNLLQKVCEIYGIGLSVLFEADAALLEKDMICAFRKNKLSTDDLKEVNYFKSVVRNYLKMTNLSLDEVEC